MSQKIMISHSSRDQYIADCISNLLKKCSLNQILPWFSSDEFSGGIAAGQRWFDRIQSELRNSKTIVVLLTPNSLNSSWVQFEAGFGAGTAELELIPVVFGIEDLTLVPNPLSHWQIFNLSTRETTITFLRKILTALNIHFDDDVATLASARFVADLGKVNFTEPKMKNNDREEKITRDYLDKKFFDLTASIAGQNTNFSSYKVKFINEFSGQYINIVIDIDTTIDNVFDQIYFDINHHVEPYTYLSEWVVVEISTETWIVIREVANRIPAHFVFSETGSFAVRPLNRPYTAEQIGHKDPY